MCEEGRTGSPRMLGRRDDTAVGSCISVNLSVIIYYMLQVMLSDCPTGFNRNPNSYSRTGYVI